MLETILYGDNYNAPLKIRISKTLNSIREDIEKASNKSEFSDYIRWYFKKNDINLEIGEILVTKVKKALANIISEEIYKLFRINTSFHIKPLYEEDEDDFIRTKYVGVAIYLEISFYINFNKM